MKNFKSIIMMGFMLLLVMLSKPAMANGLSSFTDIPNFSVVIGANMYTLDYANDLKNENQIRDAVVKHKGDIFIKTDDSKWIKNDGGIQVNKDSVDISTIKYSNGQEIGGSIASNETNSTSGPISSNIYLPAGEVDFLSTKLIKTAANKATFKYKILDKAGKDITKAIPAYEMMTNFWIDSKGGSISLDPLTGTGTILYDFSDTDQFVIVQLVCSNGVSGKSTLALGDAKAEDILEVSDISIVSANSMTSPNKIQNNANLTKTGANTTTFQYKVKNKYDINITKKIPASQIEAVVSVSSTVTLDPSTATGTITYNSSTDVNKPISISLKDKLTGQKVDSALFTSQDVTENPRVSKITINSDKIGIAPLTGIGYTTYRVFNQYGFDITNSTLSDGVKFKSEAGTIVSKGGIITMTANTGTNLSTLKSVVITGSDSITGTSTSATLDVR
ncbi:hypothetical protein LGL55_12235 [Clostridium tagluense]|uniref:hypothetical protein n=1 Tax=Clostridium tagluense TaxID=360422 RepID=UPI001CF57770|nr:hypothetical protein [Clostridium tagluense]MCB2312150.1 hypothetical protein [Clostridium tagluense]MCB2316665.1 hypothetical protein [Clostridium tagluense]MCB2321597.1 hypothetical protein [Clostridium tagluense]MCB2326534.1 hypothetical protein [Clostridium tagluense]MCB2331257.1 hypothetical protein [Clostridium tagluense]